MNLDNPNRTVPDLGLKADHNPQFWTTHNLKNLVGELNERAELHLPNKCIKCGQPGMPVFIKRTYFPIWGYAILISYFFISRRVKIRFTLCPEHHHQHILNLWLFLASIVLAVTLAFLQYFILALIALPIFCLTAYLYRFVISVNKVKGNRVWLTGCKPAFLTQFPRQ